MANTFTTINSSVVRKLMNEVAIQYDGKEITVTALWDTGATNTCISEEVVKYLSIPETGRITILTPSGEKECSTYLVDVKLPNDTLVNDLVVIGSEIGKQNLGLLIGMDIITLGDFAVSNKDSRTIFTFRMPSEQKIDFVKEQRIAKLIGPKHGTKKKK